VRRPWKILSWVIALGVLGALIGQAAYRQIRAKRRAAAGTAVAGDHTERIRVTYKPVELGTVRRMLVLTGTVKPMAEVRVMSKVGGRLDELRLKDGTPVDEGLAIPKKGARIAVIDHEMFDAQVQQAEAALAAATAEQEKVKAGARPEELAIGEARARGAQAAVKAAEAGLSQAKATEAHAQRDSARTEELARKGVESPERVDAMRTAATVARERRQAADEHLRAANEQWISARTELALLKAGARREDREAIAARVAQATAALRLAKITLEESTIKAPIAGVVAEKSIDEGNMVSPGVCIVRIVQTDTVKIIVGVGDRFVSLIEPGKTKATVTVDAYEDAPFEGTVERVSPVADARTMTVPVEIHVPNPKHRLKPGMFARVRLVLAEREGVPVIPDYALVRPENGPPHVFVVNGNTAHRRPVTLGLAEGATVEIVKGAKAGDRVITRGQHLVREGLTVDAVEEGSHE